MTAVAQEIGHAERPISRFQKAEESGAIAGMAATALVQYLEKQGIDGNLILKQARLSPAELEDRYVYISLRAMARALELAAEATGDASFALHFAESFEPAVSHACCYAMKSAPSLRAALDALADHRNNVVDVPTEFTIDGEISRFNWTFSQHFDTPEHITGYTMMRTLYHIQRAAGEDWQPLETHLTYDAPEDDSEHRRIFGQNVHFGMAENSFVFESYLLERELPNADPDLYRVARSSYQKPVPLTLGESNPVDRVRKFVGERLDKGNATLNAAAAHVGMTQHQLRRILKKRGTCFQCLVDDTRKAMAKHYLTHTELRLSEITFLIGFSDQSVFTRAVKRWFGVTPKQMRRP